MDLVRGSAVILVVLFHAAALPEELFAIDVPQWAARTNRGLQPFRQPVLLAISGMLLPVSLTKPLSTYYAGKVRRIAWPFCVWTIITVLLLSPALLWTEPTIWYRGFIHTWFLSTLVLCYFAAPLLRRGPWALYGVAMFAIWFGVGPVFPGGERVWFYGAFFFLGAALAAHATSVRTLPAWAACGSLCVVMVGVAGAVTGAAGYALRLHWALISTCGIIFFVWAAQRIPTSRSTQPLELVGRNSLPAYVVHVPAMLILGQVWVAAGLTGGPLAYLTFAAVGLIGPWAVTRVPGSRLLFELPRQRSVETAKVNPHV